MSVKIGLDAGHGLYTPGKQTPTGIKEWTLNDKVCDKIQAILNNYNCIVIRTDNNEGKTDEPLSERVNKYLKEGVTAFVSIHHNAYTGNWNGATGVEVYTDRNPIPADDKLAKLVYDKLVKYTGLKGRGIKKSNFAVINQNKIAAILVEGGFMDSTTDYKIITSDEGQSNYARAVAEGLIEFCNLKKKNIPTPKPSAKTSVIYQSHDYTKNKWLPNVTDNFDYAGNFGNAVDGLKANLTKGNIWYKVHIKATKTYKGRWLPEVKNRTDFAGNIGQPIDAVMIRSDVGTVKYQVHIAGGKWLPEVSGYNEKDTKNGFAGNIGQFIDAIKIHIV